MNPERPPAGARQRNTARERQEAERAEAAEKVAEAAAEIAVEVVRDADETLAKAELPRQMVILPSKELLTALTSVLERLQAGHPAGAATAPYPDPVGTRLTTEQERLALNYDALRTALGRPGAASIVLYRIVPCKDDPHRLADEVAEHGHEAAVVIEHGHVDADSWIVVYGPQYEGRDGTYGEIGRARYCPDGPTCIRGLHIGQHIDRLEVHDRHDRPVRLGRPLPHHDTRVPEL